LIAAVYLVYINTDKSLPHRKVANIMAEARSEKIIRLTALKPSEYHLWASQSEATFRVYGALDIVLGYEPKPIVSEQVVW